MKIIKGCLGKHFLQSSTATEKIKQSRPSALRVVVCGPGSGADQKEVTLWDLHVCVDPS